MTKDLPEDLRYILDLYIPHTALWSREHITHVCQKAYYLGRKSNEKADYTSMTIIFSVLFICITAVLIAYNK